MFRSTFNALTQAMKAQTNLEIAAPANPRVGDFTRMNPREFHGSRGISTRVY